MIIPNGFPKLPNDFEYDTEVQQSTDGEHAIFFNWFKKKNTKPKKALLIIHGQGEHGGRYQHFAHFLKDEYDLILAPDLRGHGRSEGIRGHVDSFDEYVDDALLAYETLRSRLPKTATIDWFSHSMGGTVSLRAFSLRAIPVRNAIFSAPCLEIKAPVPLVKDLAARLLSRVWGSLQLETDLDSSKLTHDVNVVNAIKQDQLHHTKATPKFYLSFLYAMEKLQTAEFQFPSKARILFQLAGEDKIVNTDVGHQFFESLKHELKTEMVYTGLDHEIYNETSKEHVFQDLITWIHQGEAK